eukprot:TRINITY_DN4105_c0_g1_i4.p1 TRINITY_DN4105_c0_g1~~TRINITY_DN4105_c0_g1_i4.p1  ORF type:complete len:241 (+),score=35.51 TRINITY_DN4105_c0_g1_i4:72-794(+)
MLSLQEEEGKASEKEFLQTNEEDVEESKNVELLSTKNELQERFEMFRLNKVERIRNDHGLLPSKKPDERTPEFKAALRAKFIEAARKYVGVPYRKRFLKPTDPLYKSKIFLDCCGLVRQAVFDLRKEFGFILPDFNQNYQFDSLPIEVPFDELKPGDLIFYEATYYKPEEFRHQIHNMVHVEIYIGGETKEATLASRSRVGTVGIFPSYKFESKNYYNVKHHFRSLDTCLLYTSPSPRDS